MQFFGGMVYGSALAGESVAILGRWWQRVGVGASSAACHRGFCSLALGWARWQGGIDGMSAYPRNIVLLIDCPS